MCRKNRLEKGVSTQFSYRPLRGCLKVLRGREIELGNVVRVVENGGFGIKNEGAG